jgi:AcrR family transcriptional regulator
MRADARKNVAAILDAAQVRLAGDPHATMADIARAAGVGRVTLYGHFGTRADLVDAVLEAVTRQANDVLDEVETGGDPSTALVRLIGASWTVVDRFRAILAAAEQELPAERIRDHHDRHFERLAALLAAAQRSGAVRTDLPRQWLVATVYTVIHAAARECSLGRLEPDLAERAIVGTLLAALTPPGATVPPMPG